MLARSLSPLRCPLLTHRRAPEFGPDLSWSAPVDYAMTAIPPSSGQANCCWPDSWAADSSTHSWCWSLIFSFFVNVAPLLLSCKWQPHSGHWLICGSIAWKFRTAESARADEAHGGMGMRACTAASGRWARLIAMAHCWQNLKLEESCIRKIGDRSPPYLVVGVCWLTYCAGLARSVGGELQVARAIFTIVVPLDMVSYSPFTIERCGCLPRRRRPNAVRFTTSLFRAAWKFLDKRMGAIRNSHDNLESVGYSNMAARPMRASTRKVTTPTFAESPRQQPAELLTISTAALSR